MTASAVHDQLSQEKSPNGADISVNNDKFRKEVMYLCGARPPVKRLNGSFLEKMSVFSISNRKSEKHNKHISGF